MAWAAYSWPGSSAVQTAGVPSRPALRELPLNVNWRGTAFEEGRLLSRSESELAGGCWLAPTPAQASSEVR